MSAGPVSAPGILLAAPASGSGKTTSRSRCCARCAGAAARSARSRSAPTTSIRCCTRAPPGGRPLNLDSWAMRIETLAGLADEVAGGVDLVLGEGVMGLFDGAADGRGSTADLASLFDLPVILVVDARGMAASAAALVEGFTRHRDDVEVAGVLFNRVASDRARGAAAARLRRPLRPAGAGLPAERSAPRVAGAPSGPGAGGRAARARGLPRARRGPGRRAHRPRPADAARATRSGSACTDRRARPLRPLGQRIAVADDLAFALRLSARCSTGWRSAGAEVLPFSPLADEAPDAGADAVYLPGGYPELHAGRLAGEPRASSTACARRRRAARSSMASAAASWRSAGR